MHKNVYIII